MSRIEWSPDQQNVGVFIGLGISQSIFIGEYIDQLEMVDRGLVGAIARGLIGAGGSYR